MKFFAASFTLQLKRLSRRGATLACLLVAPLLTLALGLALPATGGENPVTVGVLLPQNTASQAANQLWQGLSAASNDEIRYRQAQSFEQLEELVAAGVWECGYVLPDDLDARLSEGRTARMLTRVQSSATTMAVLTDWTVSAALLDVCAPQLAADYLAGAGFADAQQQAALAPALQAAFGTGQLMALETLPVSGRALPEGGSALLTGAALVRGMVALLLFLFSCLCAVRFSADMALGFFARLRPYATAAGLYFPAFAAAGFLSAAAGGVCLAVAAAFFPGGFAGLWAEAGCLLLYLMYLAAFSYFLSVLFAGRQLLVSLLPFLMVACLLLCPILIDLTLVVPALRPAALLLPPTLYLRAAAGQTAALWQMPLAAALLLGAGLLLAWLRRRGAAARAAGAQAWQW